VLSDVVGLSGSMESLWSDNVKSCDNLNRLQSECCSVFLICFFDSEPVKLVFCDDQFSVWQCRFGLALSRIFSVLSMIDKVI